MQVKLSLSCQLSSKPSIAVLSAWPIHYACVWGPFVAAFDVLSVGRWWNLPASRLTTVPYFSPSDSQEVSSWQRFERETVDEIDCGTMMWEEVTHFFYHWKAQIRGEVNTGEHNHMETSLPPIRFWPLPSVTISNCRCPQHQDLKSCQIHHARSLLWVLNYIYYDNEAAGSIYTKLWGFHLLPCHWYCTLLCCTSVSKTLPREGVDLQVGTSGASCPVEKSERWEKWKAHSPLISDIL